MIIAGLMQKKTEKKIAFEIGTEEQNGSTNSPEELELTLELTKKFCQKNKIDMPTFCSCSIWNIGERNDKCRNF